MTEIKSTIDIIMEKTKGLRLSEEEKKEMRFQKAEQEASGLCLKYLDGEISFDTLKRRIEDAPEDVRQSMTTTVMDMLVRSIDLNKSNIRAIDTLKMFIHREDNTIYKRISELISNYQKYKHKRARKFKVNIWQQLREKGISGSAVEPNLEMSPQWQEELKRVASKFEEKLERLKKELAEGLIKAYPNRSVTAFFDRRMRDKQ